MANITTAPPESRPSVTPSSKTLLFRPASDPIETIDAATATTPAVQHIFVDDKGWRRRAFFLIGLMVKLVLVAIAGATFLAVTGAVVDLDEAPEPTQLISGVIG